jgi:hypothetical protein
VDVATLPPPLAAVAELTAGELSVRSLRIGPARAALARAHQASFRAGIPALMAEVAQARAALDRPAARRVVNGESGDLRLDEIEALLASGTLVLDGCRRGLAVGGRWLSLARRPILFSLARSLAQAWPHDAERDTMIAEAFRMRRPDETHRARLRVEIGRLRALLKGLATVEATPKGFRLSPHEGATVAVIAPPIEGEQASLVALLSDGAAWSTSALALALGASQRTVQRALADLQAAGQVRAIGRARAQRWLAPPLADITPILLLPASLPGA